MTTLHDGFGPRQIVSLAIDVNELADALAQRLFAAFPDPAPEGYVDTCTALEWMGWGKAGYDRLLLRVQEESIPHRRVGSRIYFKLSELTEWIDGGGS